MYICMCACACVYTCVCVMRVHVSSQPGNVRQRVRPGVCHVTGVCHRFWQEKDDGEKEEKQEEKEARMKIIIIT